ncbi:hypothetical protein J6590_057014 [Homalodisca vitripennis]|nr:hypothetical protein J6590_057014 [Homalodisca vitripennis]
MRTLIVRSSWRNYVDVNVHSSTILGRLRGHQCPSLDHLGDITWTSISIVRPSWGDYVDVNVHFSYVAHVGQLCGSRAGGEGGSGGVSLPLQPRRSSLNVAAVGGGTTSVPPPPACTDSVIRIYWAKAPIRQLPSLTFTSTRHTRSVVSDNPPSSP